MSNQLRLFVPGDDYDVERGEILKELGMEQAANARGRPEWITLARSAAMEIAKANGFLSMDDVNEWFARRGVNLPAILGNGCGSVLAHDGRFVNTGTYIKSRRVSRHANRIAVWRLR